MKELSIEEKAKRYDKAIERAKKWYNAPNVDKIPTFGNRIIEDIFPELKESEDERIRKNLIGYIKGVNEREVCKETLNEWIAWLEKQGEQKPVDKVESNKKFTPIESALKDLICDVDNSYTIEQVRRFLFEYGYKDKILNAAQEEIQKPAWSEEDENRINRLIAYFEDKESFTAEDDIAYANWLKSLKPQNRWKPSNEQMEALDAFIEKACAYLDEKCRKFILTAKDIEDFRKYMEGE